MDYDHHIFCHLKSPLYNEIMEFYVQILKFSTIIVQLNESLLQFLIKPQHIIPNLKVSP
jgi:hypothetical protein